MEKESRPRRMDRRRRFRAQGIPGKDVPPRGEAEDHRLPVHRRRRKRVPSGQGAHRVEEMGRDRAGGFPLRRLPRGRGFRIHQDGD